MCRPSATVEIRWDCTAVYNSGERFDGMHELQILRTFLSNLNISEKMVGVFDSYKQNTRV